MTFRRVLVLGACLALTAACSKTEPIMLASPTSDTTNPQGSTATDSPSSTSTQSEGRYIARCTTEANGDGTPGTTYFTDGSQGITDYCLRRYYIGVQPAPGAVYVPNEDSGWSQDAPAQPRDGGPSQGGQPQQLPRRDGEDFIALGQAPRDNLGATPASPQQPGGGPNDQNRQDRQNGHTGNGTGEPDQPTGTTPTTGADQAAGGTDTTPAEQQPQIPGLPPLPGTGPGTDQNPSPSQPDTGAPGTGDQDTVRPDAGGTNNGGVGGDSPTDLPPDDEPLPQEPAPTGSSPAPGSTGSGSFLTPHPSPGMAPQSTTEPSSLPGSSESD